MQADTKVEADSILAVSSKANQITNNHQARKTAIEEACCPLKTKNLNEHEIASLLD